MHVGWPRQHTEVLLLESCCCRFAGLPRTQVTLVLQHTNYSQGALGTTSERVVTFGDLCLCGEEGGSQVCGSELLDDHY